MILRSLPTQPILCGRQGCLFLNHPATSVPACHSQLEMSLQVTSSAQSSWTEVQRHKSKHTAHEANSKQLLLSPPPRVYQGLNLLPFHHLGSEGGPGGPQLLRLPSPHPVASSPGAADLIHLLNLLQMSPHRRQKPPDNNRAFQQASCFYLDATHILVHSNVC